TVLARAAAAAGMSWDQEQAHSAKYDAERTAELFCMIVNRWDETVGVITAPARAEEDAEEHSSAE
ncbi:MAG: ribonuclease T, partial [Thiogranum sp.]